ncbi:unnamed protein product, partial [Ectocarpus sp. 13 AM-2016]
NSIPLRDHTYREEAASPCLSPRTTSTTWIVGDRTRRLPRGFSARTRCRTCRIPFGRQEPDR